MFGSCRQVMGVSWRSERSSWASSGEEGVQWLQGHRTLQSQGHSHSLSESLNLWRTEAYTLTVFEAGMCQERAATGLRSTEGYFLLPRKYPASSARAEDTEFSHGGRQRCTERKLTFQPLHVQPLQKGVNLLVRLDAPHLAPTPCGTCE